MVTRTLLTREEAKAKVNAVFARVIGLVSVVIGITGVVLTGWASYKVYLLEHWPGGAFAVIGVFVLISLFFLHVGRRLVLNRPNRYGSFFGPFGWRTLGVIFGLLGLGLFATFVGLMTLDNVATIAVPVISCLVFSFMCFHSAKKAAANASTNAL